MARRSTQSDLKESTGRLPHRNLSSQATDSIRGLIFNGHYQRGAHIIEAHLAAALGVSHGTVRVGLQQLQHEGIVEHRPHRGVFVRRLDSRDAREVYTLRNTLEAMAARLAAGRATDDARQELQAILNQMRTAVETGDRSAAISSDFEFHCVVACLSGHRLLQEHYHLIELKTRLFMVLTDTLYPDLSYMLSHEPLIEAIAAGDADRAEALAAQHNNESGERLIQYLEHMEAGGDTDSSDSSNSPEGLKGVASANSQ